MKRVFEHPPEAADRKALLAQPRRAERHAGISRLARARVSRRRGAARRRRLVAARFPETDGSVDGAGRLWPDQLSPSGSAPRAVYEERRVGDSRQVSLLRHGDAAADRRDSARGHDARRPADQDRRQPAPSRERRGDRRLRASFHPRSLRSGALETLRRKRRKDAKAARRSRTSRRGIGRPSRNISRNFARRSRPTAARVSRFWSRKCIRPRANVCARSCKRLSRRCAGASTTRS